MMPMVGFLPGTDPRIVGTVDAIERDLLKDGFVARYETSPDGAVDGLPAGEGAFLPCSFWLADNLALIGRNDDAVALFERLLGLANDVGLLAEEYDGGGPGPPARQLPAGVHARLPREHRRPPLAARCRCDRASPACSSDPRRSRLTSTLTEIVIDCADPEPLAEFWCAVLGWKVVDRDEGDVEIGDRMAVGRRCSSSRCRKRRSSRTASTSTCDRPTATSEPRSSGSSGSARSPSTSARATSSWVVLADPEGNEFCVLRGPLSRGTRPGYQGASGQTARVRNSASHSASRAR